MAQPQPDQQKVQSLIVPLRQHNLILPQASLAEVITMPDLRKIDGSEDWLVGVFYWRQQDIPLISMEEYCSLEDSDQITRTRRVAIFYGVEKIPGIEYYAVEIQAIPHPVSLGAGDIVSLEDGLDCEIIAESVEALGVKGFLPDLPLLENRLREQMEML